MKQYSLDHSMYPQPSPLTSLFEMQSASHYLSRGSLVQMTQRLGGHRTVSVFFEFVWTSFSPTHLSIRFTMGLANPSRT
jgi:hypothetical protein